MPLFLCCWGEFLKAFLKIAQIAFQKCSSEDGWSSWWKHRTEMAAYIISGMDAYQLMFIYLHQSNVTFENNQNDCFCQLVTSPTPTPAQSWSISKWLRMGHSLYHQPHHSPISVLTLWPLPVSGCEMILQLGCISSLHTGRVHCPLHCSIYGQGSCPVAIPKVGTWKGSVCACRNSLNNIITHSEVKLCGMWVEIYKNTMSHFILPVVAMRLFLTQPAITAESQTEEVANSHLPTQTRGLETLP